MKKSEKVKGKEAVADRKKKLKQYTIILVIALVIIAAIAYYFFNPFMAHTGDTVAVYYTGVLDNGTVVESNLNGTPLIFTLGKEDIIPSGMGEVIIGMQANETKTVKLPPEKAFGVYDPTLVQTVNRSSLPQDAILAEGASYQIIRKSDNAVAHVKIISVNSSTVTWDGNSDLAGQNLTLTVQLVEIVKK